jgi:hypothetical protein
MARPVRRAGRAHSKRAKALPCAALRRFFEELDSGFRRNDESKKTSPAPSPE